MEYDFTDYSEYDPERGGSTPNFSFAVDGDTLEASVSGDGCYDPPETPKNKGEVLDLLAVRLQTLRNEERNLTAFIVAAERTTKFAS